MRFRLIFAILVAGLLVASAPHAMAGPVRPDATRTVGGRASLSGGTAEPAVIVELVPDNPGPYFGGERVIVDVWADVQIDLLVGILKVQLDFSDSDPGLVLDSTFSFDYTASPRGSEGWLETSTGLPVPYTFMALACACGDHLLIPSEDGLIHLGSLGLELPNHPNTYRLDALNADQPFDIARAGSELEPVDIDTAIFGEMDPWRAYDGSMGGGILNFVVVPEPATLVLLLIGAGVANAVTRRRR